MNMDYFSQRKYVLDFLEEILLFRCKLPSTIMVLDLDIRSENNIL